MIISVARGQERAQGKNRGEKAAGRCAVDHVHGQESPPGSKSPTNSKGDLHKSKGHTGLDFPREALLTVRPAFPGLTPRGSSTQTCLSSPILQQILGVFSWWTLRQAASAAQVSKESAPFLCEAKALHTALSCQDPAQIQ